jgi:hypothetical protein
MGNFSRDTFDPLKRYASVRLQQGVPLIDADWNEMEDIRRSELRTFLKWFVGDGLPAKSNGSRNDAFRIEALSIPSVDNFRILADGSNDGSSASRYLVNGIEVFITQDIDFKSQPLHENYTGPNPPVAADVIPVDPNASKVRTIPIAAGSYLVYLDIWEREIGRGDDEQLVNPLIGVETCVRIKRDWAVRVRPGTNLPTPADSDYLINHSYAPLATIIRPSNNSAIKTENINDLRQTGITLTSLLKRLRFLEQQVLAPQFSDALNEFWPPIAQPGVNVKLFGFNFSIGNPVVNVGGVTASIVGERTATVIVVTVPPNLTRGVDIPITVSNDFGQTTSSRLLRIPPNGTLLDLRSFNPNSGIQGGAVTLLFGPNVQPINSTIWFGEKQAEVTGPAQPVFGVSPTGGGFLAGYNLSVRIPSLAPGQVKISAINEFGIVSSTGLFTVRLNSYLSGSGSGIGTGLI